MGYKWTIPKPKPGSLDEFVQRTYDIRWTYPQMRVGQAFYNCLDDLRPDLANDIVLSAIDPYHDDNLIDMAYEYVKENWDVRTEDRTFLYP